MTTEASSIKLTCQCSLSLRRCLVLLFALHQVRLSSLVHIPADAAGALYLHGHALCPGLLSFSKDIMLEAAWCSSQSSNSASKLPQPVMMQTAGCGRLGALAVRVLHHSVNVAGGMRQLHWHLNFDEWQYVINVSTEQQTVPGCEDKSPDTSMMQTAPLRIVQVLPLKSLCQTMTSICLFIKQEPGHNTHNWS